MEMLYARVQIMNLLPTPRRNIFMHIPRLGLKIASQEVLCLELCGSNMRHTHYDGCSGSTVRFWSYTLVQLLNIEGAQVVCGGVLG